MRIYRVSYTTVRDSSHGFSYHTSEREARAEAARFEANHDDPTTEIERLEIPPTRGGILNALRKCGSHPDNG